MKTLGTSVEKFNEFDERVRGEIKVSFFPETAQEYIRYERFLI